MGKHGRYERKKPKKRVSALKIVLIVLVVILLLLAAAGIFGYVYYNRMLNKINHVEVPDIVYTQPPTEAIPETTSGETQSTEETTAATTEPPHVASSEDYINFLLVGQAARVGEKTDSERMADTIILCTVNTYEKTLTMTSILRDSFVKPTNEIWRGHSFGRIKLTTVYHLGSVYEGTAAGSMELMNITLFNNFGIEVDHNFEVSFDIFMELVNAIGGVEVVLTEEEAAYMNADDLWVKMDVEPGPHKLNGMRALSFVRMRKAEGDNDSDIIRTARQRRFIEAMIAKIKTLSPAKLQKAIDKILPMVTTSMDNQEITDMIMKLLPILPELTIKTGGVCPASGWGDEVDIYGDGIYHSVMKFDESVTKKEMRAITEGEIG